VSSAWIRRRATTKGEPRYQVLYRRGGRAWPVEHAGVKKTVREARILRDFIAGELAAGRNPRESLAHALAGGPGRTVAEWFTAWKESRVDVDERTRDNYDIHWKRIEPAFGTRRPERIDHADVQAWILEIAEVLTPAVVRDYVGTLRMVIDYAGVEPNPARHRLLRFPAFEREVVSPPSAAHVVAFLARMPRERRLLYAFLEQTGIRLGEHLGWRWGDVDIEGSRILSRPEVVKGRRGSRKPRFVPVPPWLLEILLESCPPDERGETRPLFLWPHEVQHPPQRVHKAMVSACATAKIPHFHPHDLRHRRISLWHGQGRPAREIGDRVGQKQVAITLDTYTHVMPLDEISVDVYEALLRGPDREAARTGPHPLVAELLERAAAAAAVSEAARS